PFSEWFFIVVNKISREHIQQVQPVFRSDPNTIMCCGTQASHYIIAYAVFIEPVIPVAYELIPAAVHNIKSTAIGADPQMTPGIFRNAGYPVAADAVWIPVIMKKMCEDSLFAVQQVKPFVCADPKVVLGIFEDCLNYRVAQTLGVRSTCAELPDLFMFPVNQQKVMKSAYPKIARMICVNA